MKKGLLFCLLFVCTFFFSRAGNVIPADKKPKKSTIVPVQYSETEKIVAFSLPNSCSGFLNEYIEGKGTLSISVMGDIRNGKAAVRVKVAYNGEAKSSLGYAGYTVNSSTCLSVSQYITGPTDVFVQDLFKLTPTGKASSLYLGNLGYIRVYPEGNVEYHILETDSADPDSSRPAIYCQSAEAKSKGK